MRTVLGRGGGDRREARTQTFESRREGGGEGANPHLLSTYYKLGNADCFTGCSHFIQGGKEVSNMSPETQLRSRDLGSSQVSSVQSLGPFHTLPL